MPETHIQNMPRWQNENIQWFALLCSIASSIVCKQTAASIYARCLVCLPSG